MTTDTANPQPGTSFGPDAPSPTPNPDLRSLDRLVGSWSLSGPDIRGQVTYEWMEGGFFLLQRVDFVHGGRPVKGIEIIGHVQPALDRRLLRVGDGCRLAGGQGARPEHIVDWRQENS